MKLRITTILSCILLCAGSLFADHPTATYDPATGVMSVNSGLQDIVAVFIGGPDVSLPGATPNDVGCVLCDGDANIDSSFQGKVLPRPSFATDFSASDWTVGESAGSTQWIRTNPLSGLGFQGTIGDFYLDGMGAPVTPWPEDVVFGPVIIADVPGAGLGIANYGLGLGDADFDKVFSDGTGEANFSVTFATDDGRTFLSDVIVLPEPASASFLSLAGLSLLGLRRRS